MSILIKGMEMPKSCLECRLYNDPWCMAKNRNQWRTAYNRPPKGERQNDCPLVEVPKQKHGKWIYHPGGESEFDPGDFFTCSECDCATFISSDFCPYCGSDMRGEDDV